MVFPTGAKGLTWVPAGADRDLNLESVTEMEAH